LNTQFIAAAYNGDISTMKHILAEGLDINSTDMDGRTALHVAAGVGNTTVCEWLLKRGANANMRHRWGLVADSAGEWFIGGPAAAGLLSPIADGE
jgi:ankyrin repeat protein